MSCLVLLHQIFNNGLVFQFLLDEEALGCGPSFFFYITEGMICEFLSVKSFIVDQWSPINNVLETTAIVLSCTTTDEGHSLTLSVLMTSTQVKRAVSRYFRILGAGPVGPCLYGRLLLNIFESAVELWIFLRFEGPCGRKFLLDEFLRSDSLSELMPMGHFIPLLCSIE